MKAKRSNKLISDRMILLLPFMLCLVSRFDRHGAYLMNILYYFTMVMCYAICLGTSQGPFAAGWFIFRIVFHLHVLNNTRSIFLHSFGGNLFASSFIICFLGLGSSPLKCHQEIFASIIELNLVLTSFMLRLLITIRYLKQF